MAPLVSIICITYNQKKYIERALKGFLMQETDFKFEILIHDDASTDGTAEIIRNIAKDHPDVIKPVFEQENQYSQQYWGFLNDMFYGAKGKYIALCEGDDYWTDPKKLQKQVDFLEKNPNHSVCFHPVNVVYEDGRSKDRVSPSSDDVKSFTMENLLKDNYINTCSVMYRRQPYKDLPNKIMPHDIYMHVLHAKSGKIGFIDEVMGAYRKQSGGVWWNSGERMHRIYKNHRFSLTNLFSELLQLLPDERKYRTIINNHVKYLFNAFIDIDHKGESYLFEETTRDFPELVAHFAVEQKVFINELQTENQRLSKDVHELLPAAKELEDIKKSRWYRLNPGYRKNS